MGFYAQLSPRYIGYLSAMKNAFIVCISSLFFWSELSIGQTFEEFDYAVMQRASQNQRHVLLLFEQKALKHKTPYYQMVFEEFEDPRFIAASRLVTIPERDSLAARHSISTVPALAILNPTGDLVHKLAGVPGDKTALNKVLNKSLSADESYAAMKKLLNPSRYSDPDFMLSYFQTVLRAGDKIDRVWWERWNHVSFQHKADEAIWKVAAMQLSGKAKDSLAALVRQEFDKFSKHLSVALMKPLFFDVYLRHASGYFGDEELLHERLEEFEVLEYPYLALFKTNIKLRRAVAEAELPELTAFVTGHDFRELKLESSHVVQVLNRFARVEATMSEVKDARQKLQSACLGQNEPVKHLAVAVLMYREDQREEAAKYLQRIEFEAPFQETAAELTVEILNDRLKTTVPQ